MKGFTLIEMLLSVALIALIAGMGIPLYQSFQNRNDLSLATTSLAAALRSAEVHARAVDGDSAWGVMVATSSVTVFKGVTYASRVTTSDEVTPISGSIIITGTSEYDFAKFTGFPSASATTTLTSLNNETRIITINAKGMVTN
ncbi:MAG TPA: prepilin-type N-terminal cleavage/methylation domain-containing protein [Candidatus Paceibacterota bacterium]|nr:prepilin-type N-terminal cleavage/methylation domain-containing protein [Candidatus Paceibacterota bacterium]